MTSRKKKIPQDKNNLGPELSEDFIDVEFYVPPKDNQGHSEIFTMKIAPSYGAEINTLVQRSDIPYDTSADLIRHAVVRHIKWLHSLGTLPSTVWSVLKALEPLEAQDNIRANIGKHIDKINETFGELAKATKWDVILDNIAGIRSMLDGLPDNSNRRQVEARYNPTLDYYQNLALQNFEKVLLRQREHLEEIAIESIFEFQEEVVH